MGDVGRLFVYDDVRTLTAGLLRQRCGRLPSVIVGSPPCQDASCANAGGRGVDGERTGLFFEAIRIVGECRPVWGCFENVPGLRGRGLDRVLGGLEAEGYAVWPLVMGADDFGAPHRRKRLWIVFADATDLDATSEPMGITGQSREARLGDAADATSDARRLHARPRPERQQVSPNVGGVDRHPDSARLAVGQGERGDAFAQLPPVIRTIAEGSGWNGGADGLVGSLRMADGLPAGVARQCIAAFGDAVVPQITEAIGRTMMRLLPTDGTVMDLFCGAAAGWSLGLHRAGYRTIAACEIDPWRRSVFAARFGEWEGDL